MTGNAAGANEQVEYSPIIAGGENNCGAISCSLSFISTNDALFELKCLCKVVVVTCAKLKS